MTDYTDINETKVAFFTISHMFRNLKQLQFESFKLQQKYYYIRKNTHITSISLDKTNAPEASVEADVYFINAKHMI